MPEQNERRPKILISGGGGDSKSVAAIVTQLQAAGVMSGGVEIKVVVDQADRMAKRGDVNKVVAEDLAGVDAIIVMGNNGDIDPKEYGDENKGKSNSERIKKIKQDGKEIEVPNEAAIARRDYEVAALKKALEMKMPVLGICGGLQRINVLDHAENKGTLLQHVPDALQERGIVDINLHAQQDSNIPPFVPVQFIKIEEGTTLAGIAQSLPGLYAPGHGELPPGVVMENSMHHQAVKDVHKEFRVAAKSEDGIIEAIEPKKDGRYAGQFVLGVQWHPEFGADDTKMIGPKIAVRMIEEARTYGKAHPRTQEAPQAAVLGVPSPWASEVLKQRQNAILGRAL